MFMATADRQAICALSPRAVVGYLRDNGWEKRRDFGENAAVFGSTVDGIAHELLVPVASQARDFRAVMEVLIEDLVKIEDRSPHDLLSDLTMAAFDVIRIRSPDADSIGSVQLRAGVELYEGARELMLSAANAAASDRPRAVWAGRRPEQVNDYLASIRLAQSQRGSFVISLLSPWDFVPSVDRDQGDLDFVEPFGRRVATALAKALDAAGKALRASATEGVRKPFTAAVQAGVSSNLCQALAQIARDGDGADISIRWSLTKPAQGRPMLRLAREDAQSFTEAAEKPF
jgi:hypothetical protein